MPSSGRIRGSLRRLAIWVVVLSMWEGGYRFIGWESWIFPAPSHVLDAMAAMLEIDTDFGEPVARGWPLNAPTENLQPVDPQTPPPAFAGRQKPWYQRPLIEALVVSLSRLAVGFTLSILIGGFLGVLMWRFAEVDEFLGGLLLGLQTLPSVCWVPLAVLVVGLNETGVLFVLVMGSFAAIAIALRDGLRTIPPLFQRAGMMLGAHGWKLYAYVLLPASLPALATSLRQGFSFAWRSLMGAELLFQAVRYHGLGFQLEAGRSFNDVAQVIAVLIIMISIGMFADRWAFAALQRRVQARFGLQA